MFPWIFPSKPRPSSLLLGCPSHPSPQWWMQPQRLAKSLGQQTTKKTLWKLYSNIRGVDALFVYRTTRNTLILGGYSGRWPINSSWYDAFLVSRGHPTGTSTTGAPGPGSEVLFGRWELLKMAQTHQSLTLPRYRCRCHSSVCFHDQIAIELDEKLAPSCCGEGSFGKNLQQSWASESSTTRMDQMWKPWESKPLWARVEESVNMLSESRTSLASHLFFGLQDK